MSVPFRTEFLGGSATIRVEAAFGADLTVNSASWSWTDITTSVLYADYAGVTVSTMGRSDSSGTAQPASFGFALKNDTGNFTAYNPSSTNYPYIRRSTPIRCVVNLGAADSIRAQGYANGWVPSWDVSGDHSIVRVSCSGVLRRMQQGSPVISSAIYRSTSAAAGLVAYAPMEEDSGATTISVAGGRSRNALFGGTVSFAGDTTLGGTKQAIVMNATSYLSLNTQGHTFSGQWQIDWFMKFTGSTPAAETIIMRGYTDNPNAMFIDAVYGGSTWGVRAYDKFGGAVGNAVFSPPTGQATGWWHWRLMAHDGGSGGTDYQLVTFSVADGSGSAAPLTVAGVSPGNLTACAIRPSAAAFDGVAIAHLAVYDRWNFSAVDSSADGYAGESATTRIARLAAEEDIEISVSGTSSVMMGAQKPNSVVALLRECEVADGGVLFDGRNAGLSYVAESSRYNATAALTLSATAKNIIGAPNTFDDDQRNVNRATVTRTGGGSSTFQQFDGNLGSDAIGVYDASVTANLEDDADAFDLASWLVHLGQAEGFRYPQLSLDLIGIAKQAGSNALPTSWLNCTVGSRIDMSNLRSVAATHPPGTVQTLLEGWSEQLTPKTWQAGPNCSAFSSWDTGVIDTYLEDCGASVLGTAMTTSTTSMDVLVSDDCNWSHADGNLSITVGGEEMTLTAVGATTTPTPALVAVGTAGTGNASAVTPGLPGGLTAAGNLMLMLASVRDTNAIATDMYVTGTTGWKKLFDGVNLSLFAKVHNGAEVAPTVNYIAGISGDTVIAQIASFTGKWGDPASQTVALAQQVNAAAQDIAYPSLNVPIGGVLLVWMGWKADDWTSVATLGGITEISEATSTLGNDAGIVWDYNTSVGIPSVGGGSFVVTGGTSQISRSALIAIRSVYQTVTVTRGVNGLTRAHAVGETVRVTHPLILARQ